MEKAHRETAAQKEAGQEKSVPKTHTYEINVRQALR